MTNAREQLLNVCDELSALEGRTSDKKGPEPKEEKPSTPPFPPPLSTKGAAAESLPRLTIRKDATPEPSGSTPAATAPNASLNSTRGATPESIGGASVATAPKALLTSTTGATPASTGGASDTPIPKPLSDYEEIDLKWKEFQARFNEVNRLLVANIARSFAAEQESKQKETVSSLRNLQRNERLKNIA
jgi:hypothetical protein